MISARPSYRDEDGRLVVELVPNAGGALLSPTDPVVGAMRAVIEHANAAFKAGPDHLPPVYVGVVTSDDVRELLRVAEAAAQFWGLAGETGVPTSERAQPYLAAANSWATTAWKTAAPARIDWSIVFPTPWGHPLGPEEIKVIMGVRTEADVHPTAIQNPVQELPTSPFPTAGATDAEIKAVLLEAAAELGPSPTRAEVEAWIDAELAKLPTTPTHARVVLNAVRAQLPPTPITEPDANPSTPGAAPFIGSAIGGLLGGLAGAQSGSKYGAEIGGAVGAIVGAVAGSNWKG